MQKITQNEIINKIETQKEELTAVEIIRNHENTAECSVILNDKWLSIPYETEYSYELVNTIKNTLPEEVLLISFIDKELPEAWKQSYLMGGIPEERHDRRVKFNSYNTMNELFCIDRTLLEDITDKWVGTPWEGTPKWKEGIIKWYKNHLI